MTRRKSDFVRRICFIFIVRTSSMALLSPLPLPRREDTVQVIDHYSWRGKPKAIFTMIKDAGELDRVQKEWAGVSNLRGRIKVNLFAGAGLFGHFSHFLADCANNLPFLHAC